MPAETTETHLFSANRHDFHAVFAVVPVRGSIDASPALVQRNTFLVTRIEALRTRKQSRDLDPRAR
jgi:hypothetical protein